MTDERCQVCQSGSVADEVLYFPTRVPVMLAMLATHGDPEASLTENYPTWPSAKVCAVCAARISDLPGLPEPTMEQALAVTTDSYVRYLQEQLQAPGYTTGAVEPPDGGDPA